MKETSRTLTRDVNDLPACIKDAIADGYTVMIRREVKDGVVSAKVTYYKYASCNKFFVGLEREVLKK